jgi:DNA-binding NarL/FixJ family response regulator
MPSVFGDRSQHSASPVNQLRRTHANNESASENESACVKEVWNLARQSSTEADVIEQLTFLATSIAVSSQQQSTLHSFVTLLRSLIRAIEAGEFTSLGVTSHSPISSAGIKKAESAVSVLTTRQREVLQMRSMGLCVDAIAERLNLTPRTVRTHIRDAVERLGVTGGTMAAVAEARDLGLI